MEKIVVRIGRVGKGSSSRTAPTRTPAQDIEFLMDTLEISYKRAEKLVRTLASDLNRTTSTSDFITVVLNYRQLARYTAKRQVNGLNTYWKYPHVLELIEEEEPPVSQLIELRPTYRVTSV